MNTETPQLVISRVFDAPRELVYRAFTDPDHLMNVQTVAADHRAVEAWPS
jgi:uncharacterized protein YndB with AHSA1/START domain